MSGATVQNDFVASARREILAHGIVPDALLARDFDTPAFGFNLACAWPLPSSAKASYEQLAERLRALGPEVYIYPAWQIHVTIATFINFTLHKNIAPERKTQLESLMPPVKEMLRDVVKIAPFELVFGKPVLTRKAAILPITDSAGAISHIRQKIREELAGDAALSAELNRGGINIPGIVHTTIMRFQSTPSNLPKFLAEFDEVAAETQPFPVAIDELLMTTETKIYMREGEIAHRFPLSERLRSDNENLF